MLVLNINLICIPEGGSHAILLDLCIFTGLTGEVLLFTCGGSFRARTAIPL